MSPLSLLQLFYDLAVYFSAAARCIRLVCINVHSPVSYTHLLDGTVFRSPIVVKGIEPCVKNWKKPITIARHAYGDVYKGVEIKVPGAGTAELVYTAADGSQIKETIHKFDGPGIIQGMHNVSASIESFARSCFNYALDVKQDLWFATKDTISKKYDHTFKDIFQEIFDAEYAGKFEKEMCIRDSFSAG